MGRGSSLRPLRRGPLAWRGGWERRCRGEPGRRAVTGLTGVHGDPVREARGPARLAGAQVTPWGPRKDQCLPMGLGEGLPIPLTWAVFRQISCPPRRPRGQPQRHWACCLGHAPLPQGQLSGRTSCPGRRSTPPPASPTRGRGVFWRGGQAPPWTGDLREGNTGSSSGASTGGSVSHALRSGRGGRGGTRAAGGLRLTRCRRGITHASSDF